MPAIPVGLRSTGKFGKNEMPGKPGIFRLLEVR